MEQWLEDSGASSNITHIKDKRTDVEECKIEITVGNEKTMKCKWRGLVNMHLQGGLKSK